MEQNKNKGKSKRSARDGGDRARRRGQHEGGVERGERARLTPAQERRAHPLVSEDEPRSAREEQDRYEQDYDI